MPPPPPTPTPTPSGCVAAARQTLAINGSGEQIGVARSVRQGGPETIPGRIVVRFASNAFNAKVAQTLDSFGARPLGVMNAENATSFELPSSVDPNRAAAALRALPGVMYAGPAVARYPLLMPNDPNYTNLRQWSLFVGDMAHAWDVTTGLPSIKIAVIDTGADLTHPDLAGKIDATAVFDLATGMQHTGASAQDNDGHGSNVSGIAAAATNNGIGIAAVGWNVHLMEARVFPYPSTPGGCTLADSRDIAGALDWAVANGANVINLSLGSAAPDPIYEEPAVARALAAGVPVVAASGNDGLAIIDYPAADPGVISVGASAITDTAPNVIPGAFERVAAYSNYGSGSQPLDVVAPGGDPSVAQQSCGSVSNPCDFLQWIYGLYSSTAPGNLSGFALFAGTSQASPHVAGIVALMRSKNSGLTPAQIRSIVQTSVDDIGGVRQGHGRISGCKALRDTPPPSVVTCTSSI